MWSTLQVLQLTCLTSPPSPLVQFRSQEVNKTDADQQIEGFVAAKGDFAGKEPETEEAKKKALTGVDIAIIPAGVPRMLFRLNSCECSDHFFRKAWHDQR